ncbi:hypothetical protein RHMOL_Rhmol08G0248500 [Rhododendron molle]|uniref:Uncharacterized protein n=1 Tax=Rhododendron molle TaxID=49168 RepID=A0ACC0MTC9_RHOML|nr:hypothetical protein RHMOL_Rhmol08G0248500 [Rhododendron molle]
MIRNLSSIGMVQMVIGKIYILLQEFVLRFGCFLEITELQTWALPREGDHFEHNSILLLLYYLGLHVNGFIYVAALGPDEIWMLVFDANGIERVYV